MDAACIDANAGPIMEGGPVRSASSKPAPPHGCFVEGSAVHAREEFAGAEASGTAAGAATGGAASGLASGGGRTPVEAIFDAVCGSGGGGHSGIGGGDGVGGVGDVGNGGDGGDGGDGGGGCGDGVATFEGVEIGAEVGVDHADAMVAGMEIKEEEVEEVLDDMPCRVISGLYIGSLDAARNMDALRALGITHILTVAKELAPLEWPSEWTRLCVEVGDSESDADSLLPHFDRCCLFIEQASSCTAADGTAAAVLVHCLAGRSRSAAVVCAYLMRAAREPLSSAAALRHVQQVRPWARPNRAFVDQLRRYESVLQGNAVTGAACGERSATSDSAAACKESGRRAGEVRSGGGGVDVGGRDGGGGDVVAGEDEDMPWITPSNLKLAQERDSRYGARPDEGTEVGCITTDYAMQSVLLQMGLKLLSIEGMLMRSVKQWVLRCSGCFQQHRQLDRQFCSKCGNASLVRLAAIFDSHGRMRLLPEAGAPARVRSTNVRGTKFSMPAPQVGRHAKNLILAEDQLEEAKQKAHRQGKKKSANVFDADYNLDDHFGRRGKKGTPQTVNLKVGYGKRNPNDVRSRPKRA